MCPKACALAGPGGPQTALAARYLESAYSAHVNITPTALLPVDQGKRLAIVGCLERVESHWAARAAVAL